MVVAFITFLIAGMFGGAVCGLILAGIIDEKEKYWLGAGPAIGAPIGLMVGIAVVISTYMCYFKGRCQHNGYHQPP